MKKIEYKVLVNEPLTGIPGRGRIYTELKDTCPMVVYRVTHGQRGTREMNIRINLQFIISNLEVGKGQGTQYLSQRAICLIFIIS